MIFNCVSLCVSCAVSFVFDCVFLCVVSFDDCMISKIRGRLNSTISAGMEIDLCRGFPPEWKSVCSVDFRRVEKGRLKEGAALAGVMLRKRENPRRDRMDRLCGAFVISIYKYA